MQGQTANEELEREQVLERFNDTAAPYPCDELIHRLFEQQVEHSPEAVAVICGAQQLTYSQLNAKANQVAHALLSHEIRPGDRVGLYVERSTEAVIGMIAILKAGAAYVPLDPGYPRERLEFMRQDGGLAAVLTTTALGGELSGVDLPVVLVHGEPSQSTGNPVVPAQTSRNLAYVIYTSGSTGTPKGVMVEHRNVLGLVINNYYAPVSCGDCVSHCASPSFDAATWEVWAPLLNGARLLIVPQCVVLDPRALNRTLIEHSVTAMWLTVGLFNEYVDALEEAFSGLRHLLTGGDTLVPSLIARALSKMKPPQHLINAYGPTETTTFATTFEIESVAGDARSIPIGKPIANARIYILNEEREPVPVGATGEIYIGGAGVSRGYLNRRELTDERFVSDPFSRAPEARLYRTGDLGQWRPDGTVEYLGRNDQQVKIRGFRIELGEIEAHLRPHPLVKEAIVLAREDEPGKKRLVAYVVERDAVEVRSEAIVPKLREYLKARLPGYMIPSAWITLEKLPLTPNGKVNRRALPEPRGWCDDSGEYGAAPASEVERTLSELWARALRVDRIGVQDDYFELGGDSLAGIDMISRIATVFNVEISFMALFRYPTVQQFAQFLEQLRAEAASSP